jgi:hypothetical protein
LEGGGGFVTVVVVIVVVVVVVATIVGFEYTFPLRVVMLEGSLFPRGVLTTGDLTGSFPLDVIGRILYPFLFCGVAR